jgi:cytochrome c biogenesis protein CcdA
MTWTFGGIFLLALIMGLRHGLDWDHVAAISDLTGTGRENTKQSMTLGFCYAFGHEIIVLLIGISLLIYTWNFPGWMDFTMGKAVGLTLLFLGLIVIRSVYIHYMHNRKMTVSKKSAFGIGILHGIGAETPTQIFLFATLMGMVSVFESAVVLLLFIIGMLACHMALTWTSIKLYKRMSRFRSSWGTYLRYASSIFSITLGIIYLL